MPAKLKQEIGQVLMMMAMDFQQRLDDDLHSRGIEGVRARHRAVFLHLGRFGPSRSVDLALAAGIRPQSMMVIIHELEELGLIERRPDPGDSRAKLIDFTDTGRDFIAQLGRSTEMVWDQYSQLLSEQRLESTFDALRLLLEDRRKEQPS
jgi:DNA-binding MarR family transcriptional regulator